MMSKLEELIAQYCPEGIEWKTLPEISSNLDSKRKPVKGGAREKGSIPYYGASGIVDYVRDYIFDGDFLLISEDGANLIARKTPIAFSISGKTWVNNHAHIIKFDHYPTRKIVEHYLNSIDLLPYISGVAQPKLNKQNLNNIPIPIPPLPVQEEIVNILDKFTALEAELEAELEARKHQYEYYRNQLLSFEDRTDVEWKSLGDACLKTNNIRWKENIGKDYKYIDLSAVNIDNNQIEDLQNITSENAPSRAQQIVKTNDIIFGTTRPTLKRYAIVRSDLDGHICSTGFCVLRPNQKLILPKFLFFILKSQLFFNYVENNQEGAGYPAISNTKVKNFQYPIPPLEEQERVVAILDKFDALVNDISVGLPAEIAVRREQYEYYRGKLLTFEPLAVAQ